MRWCMWPTLIFLIQWIVISPCNSELPYAFPTVEYYNLVASRKLVTWSVSSLNFKVVIWKFRSLDISCEKCPIHWQWHSNIFIHVLNFFLFFDILEVHIFLFLLEVFILLVTKKRSIHSTRWITYMKTHA
jgi:hypothetical protein